MCYSSYFILNTYSFGNVTIVNKENCSEKDKYDLLVWAYMALTICSLLKLSDSYLKDMTVAWKVTSRWPMSLIMTVTWRNLTRKICTYISTLFWQINNIQFQSQLKFCLSFVSNSNPPLKLTNCNSTMKFSPNSIFASNC